ncbi:MAG TPA: carboxypeptidase regulatory-like domain-containing protein [Candidatus Eisenbacteria bacterium]|jgi:hypothetical protein
MSTEQVRARIRGPLAALLVLLAAAPASAGALRGNVANGRTAEIRRERARDTVVWLEQVPEKTERQLTHTRFRWFRHRRVAPPLPQIVESGRMFEPHVIALAAGGTLVIRNQDKVWHGAFSVSPARAFDLGKRAPGRADTLTFDRPGVVALRCDIHPAMSAFVIVTPNHAFTRPDSAGDWRLPDLPAGHYTVHAWHPAKGELRRGVDVPAKGAANLALRW